jgi:uncharacterized protein (DUF58 family)
VTPRDILRKIRHLELRTRGLAQNAFAGRYRSAFKGRGMNFEEVREYSPGDEIRSIDWNVTARTGTPHIKRFTEEREMTVVLCVDVSASGVFGGIDRSKRELAAEIASVLAFSAIRNNDKVGLMLFSDHVELFLPPRKGRTHSLRIIREILFHEPKGRGTDPGGALENLNRIVRRRAVVFLVSDFLSRPFDRQLAVTARRHDLVAVRIEDPREKELPDVGLLALEDAETGEVIEIDTSDAALRAAYAGLAERRLHKLLETFRRQRVDTIGLSTDADYLPALRSFFDARDRRLAAE